MYFPPNKTIQFNWANCLALAAAAELAYPVAAENDAYWDHRVTREMRANGADRVRTLTNSETDTQCFIAGNPEVIVVAFRGTQPDKVRDWLTDLKAHRVAWGEKLADYDYEPLPPLTMVHQGFATALASVSNELTSTIRGFRDNAQWLFFAGHSLGGALAMLAAAQMQGTAKGRYVDGVYTFGQPRAGDGWFAREYNRMLGQVTFRLVHEEDIVARVPLYTMGFRHAGQEMFLNSAGRMQMNPPLTDKIISDAIGLLKWFKTGHAACLPLKLLRNPLLSDHFVRGYINRLERQAREAA